jgi:hypothetical protein
MGRLTGLNINRVRELKFNINKGVAGIPCRLVQIAVIYH